MLLHKYFRTGIYLTVCRSLGRRWKSFAPWHKTVWQENQNEKKVDRAQPSLYPCKGGCQKEKIGEIHAFRPMGSQLAFCIRMLPKYVRIRRSASHGADLGLPERRSGSWLLEKLHDGHGGRAAGRIPFRSQLPAGEIGTILPGLRVQRNLA